MQISLKPLSRIYDIFVISLSAGAFVTAFVPNPTAQNSSFFTTLMWLFIYFVTLLRTIRQRRQLRAIVLANLPVTALVLLCCLSTLWSIEKSATLHAVFALVLTSLIAIDFSLRYTPEEFLKTVAYTLIVLILIGLPFDVFWHVIPSDDFDPSNLHGVFGTKNAFGRLIVLAFISFLCLPKRPILVTMLYVGANYVLLYFVRSTGALVNCTILFAVFAASFSFRWDRRARQLLLLTLPFVVGAAIYFVSSNLATLTTSVGKDPSLTGRTELWRMAIRSIFDRPILGYGWGAFWNKDSQLAWRIREQANWLDAPHSHNGYIEMALGLGFIGLFTLLIVYYQLGTKSYRYALKHQSTLGKWPLMYLVLFIIYQSTEATLVGGNSIFWISFVYISLVLGRQPESDGGLVGAKRSLYSLGYRREQDLVEVNG